MSVSEDYWPAVFACGHNLRRIREKRGISQAAIARTIDRLPGFLSDLENGKRAMTPRVAVQLAAALKQKDPRELVAEAINIALKREGLVYQVARGGLRPRP